MMNGLYGLIGKLRTPQWDDTKELAHITLTVENSAELSASD